MFRNYLKITLNNLLNQKLYSVINIIGLAVGLACCILIALYVDYELGFDEEFANSDRIYRVSRDFFPGGDSTLDLQLAAIAPQAGPLLEAEFPAQVEESARLFQGSFPVYLEGGVPANENAYWVDNELFRIFEFDWLSGDPDTALSAPFSVVLTQSLARKYFPGQEAQGETLMIGNYGPAQVTGVIGDLPSNTHLDFQMLGSISTLESVPQYGTQIFEQWSANLFYTYLLLEDAQGAQVIQDFSGEFFESHYQEGSSSSTGYSLVALEDIHLLSNRESEMRPAGSLSQVTIFSAIAVFILLIACVNFMNLATAKASERAREVGVRKALGAEKRQIITQFMGESVFLALLSVACAMAIVDVSLPLFSSLMNVPLEFNYLSNPAVLAGLLLFGALVGLASGSYPSLYLSSFSSSRVLKGEITHGAGAVMFRKILVVAQFSISIVLIIATAVIFLQLDFMKAIDLGYEKENVVVIDGSSMLGFENQGWETLRSTLAAHPEINEVTRSSITPAGLQGTGAGTVRYESGPQEGVQGISFVLVDYDFFETYAIEPLAGRVFSGDFRADQMESPSPDNPRVSAAFILNEEAAAQFGWSPREAVGNWFEMSLGNRFEMSARGNIVGVVENTNFKSVRDPLEPTFYFMPPDTFAGRLQQASLRISGQNVTETLAYIDESWSEIFPYRPINRRFVDQDFNALYITEDMESRMVSTFSVLAIFIACLGLLGLAAYSTERRIKEIGIRKVLGGSTWSIVLLLTGDFSKLVLIANIIAWPAAFFAMNSWLESFSYRIDLTPMIFIGSGLIALCIAWMTVGGTAAKAARRKPVLALRYE